MQQTDAYEAARCRTRGFSLVEMAVVLAIVGVLMTGLLLPLGTQIEQREISETQKRLEDVREALLGFALVNGRLPCPATKTSAGLESPVGGGACTNPNDGFVPAQTLSFNPQGSVGNYRGFAMDAWGNPLRYSVSTVSSYAFTTYAAGTAGIRYWVDSNGFSASQLQPDLRVCTTATGISGAGSASAVCASGADVTSTTSVLAVLYSVGKNFSAQGASGTDEQANWTPDTSDVTKLTTLSRDRVYVQHEPAPSGASGGEFDDIVMWLSVGTLFSRMVTAGALP